MKKTTNLKDSAVMRWSMLLLVALTMFAAYLASDIFSPLKTMLEQHNQWTSTEYGWFSSSYSLFNVFLGLLILGGIMLDRMGIRFSGITSCLFMVVGLVIKYWAISSPELIHAASIFGLKAQVVWVVVGFGIFGVGAEVAGITVSKSIVKWFKGKELALAMGMQLSIARMGSAAALIFSPMIAAKYQSVSPSVFFGLALMIAGSLAFMVYAFYDKKLDTQMKLEIEAEESFNMKDVKSILTNKGFWLIALLCVVFYSAAFPFIKYATDLMVNKFSVDPKLAGTIPGMLPFGAIILTPLFGRIYDKIGHGADLMIIGSFMIVIIHTLFAMPFINHWIAAVILMILLGVAFSMVPSAMWPSLAKIMPERQLGTTYALTFFIQNIGLWGMPVLIGYVLDKYCIIGTHVLNGIEVNKYNYTLPMMIFAGMCSFAILLAFMVKIEDKKKGYGLQLPNIKK
ncbi:MAG: oxalate:formate antiporter [Bacteroidetes bacterium GWE2_39_28]|nr:MAG: oxalate:formate antiporter [Bacteroidetes bacterium GWE2_39_28]OFY13267.1 MAG: oxalate:formate antiporter [Bacteroidetes bacterium GWF2_39_10]OFZ11446.1 MAG: oxalate:formate antiporter [Bacteroidetes bacterium RIFOXYC2_FULL_39_11]HCT94072.1 oxalate:formate antiporter [Rikenellaceae bacterium]